MQVKLFNLFITVSVIAIAGGFIFFKKNAKPAQPTVQAEQVQGLAMDVASYVDYSEAMLETTKQKGKTILFFAATTWCQTCSALEEEIIERQAEIPPDVTILKVDYDNDTVMDEKYRVTAQHTLVVLDQDGQEVKRWLGGGFDVLLQELKGV